MPHVPRSCSKFKKIPIPVPTPFQTNFTLNTFKVSTVRLVPAGLQRDSLIRGIERGVRETRLHPWQSIVEKEYEFPEADLEIFQS